MTRAMQTQESANRMLAADYDFQPVETAFDAYVGASITEWAFVRIHWEEQTAFKVRILFPAGSVPPASAANEA